MFSTSPSLVPTLTSPNIIDLHHHDENKRCAVTSPRRLLNAHNTTSHCHQWIAPSLCCRKSRFNVRRSPRLVSSLALDVRWTMDAHILNRHMCSLALPPRAAWSNDTGVLTHLFSRIRHPTQQHPRLSAVSLLNRVRQVDLRRLSAHSVDYVSLMYLVLPSS